MLFAMGKVYPQEERRVAQMLEIIIIFEYGVLDTDLGAIYALRDGRIYVMGHVRPIIISSKCIEYSALARICGNWWIMIYMQGIGP